MAHDLGPKGIRVFAVSPGPIMTRAASGISHFNELLEHEAVVFGDPATQSQLERGYFGAKLTLSKVGQHLWGILTGYDGLNHQSPRLSQDVRGHRG